MSLTTRSLVALMVVVGALSPARPAEAATASFTTEEREFDSGVKNQGWWSDTIGNLDSNDSYAVGGCDAAIGEVRNFFTFDLTSLRGVATDARLELTRQYSLRDEESATVDFFDVSTDAATLNANEGVSRPIFEDLGTGRRYGKVTIPGGGDRSEVLTIPLRRTAVEGINRARGSFFSIGGRLSNADAARCQVAFGGSGDGVQQLVVETSNTPRSRADCKHGGWQLVVDHEGRSFANQGRCIRYVDGHP